MLEGIFNFFQWIADLIGLVFDFVVYLIEEFINFVQIAFSTVGFIMSTVSFLPGVVSTFAIMGVLVSVVLLLLGRSNNSG